jgi:ferredoxin-NADP reductase
MAGSGHLLAQMSPDEHASHHPGAAAPSAAQPAQGSPVSMPAGTAPAMGTASQSGGMTGGEMAGMMQNLSKPGCCGGATGKELFPWLMSLPDLTPAQRVDAEQKAHQRMTDGASLLNQRLGQLSDATAANDYAMMQLASEGMREGMEQFQSGLAAHRALAEDQHPQLVALQWFRTQLNLPIAMDGISRPLSLFHLSLMALLVLFAGVMIWMYVHKMRRADVLISELAAGKSDGVAVPPAGISATVTPTQGIVAAPVQASPVPSKPNSWNGKLRVMRIFQETANVKTFRLGNPSGDALPFVYLPGQFITVTVTPRGYRTRRSYTIASSPSQLDYCELTVKREEHGTVSGFLHDQVHEGDLLDVTAPSGKFTFTGKEAGSVVFIAGGVGITPFMAATRYLTDQCWTGDIYLIYSCHSPSNIIFREDLEYIQRRFANVHVTLVVSDTEGNEWKGQTGRITKELLQEVVPSVAKHHFHICGPNAFMASVREMLASLGVPSEEVMTEIFVGNEPVPKAPAAPTMPVVAGQAPQAATLPTCTFAKSNKTAPISPDRTILEVSEDIGVNIDYSCRVGTCGICKTKLLSGNVTMEVEDALTPSDKAQNIILACQAKATADVSVEA